MRMGNTKSNILSDRTNKEQTMIKFLIGYLIFSALFLWWLCYIAKHTPVSPDEEEDDDYDEFDEL